jgi:hypothetical protein
MKNLVVVVHQQNQQLMYLNVIEVFVIMDEQLMLMKNELDLNLLLMEQ